MLVEQTNPAVNALGIRHAVHDLCTDGPATNEVLLPTAKCSATIATFAAKKNPYDTVYSQFKESKFVHNSDRSACNSSCRPGALSSGH
eukprot:1044312-Amphidinium_carterae.1